MSTRRAATVLAIAAVIAGGQPSAAVADDDQSGRVTVMSRNLYVGSSYSHVLDAKDPLAFVEGATVFWSHVQQTNFRARAEALADEVAATRPDLIGLQEASLFHTQVPRDPATPATDVALDYRQILRDELAERGLSYAAVSVATDFDAEVPVFGGPSRLIDVRLTDRDVVLARTDVSQLSITGAMSGKLRRQGGAEHAGRSAADAARLERRGRRPGGRALSLREHASGAGRPAHGAARPGERAAVWPTCDQAARDRGRRLQLGRRRQHYRHLRPSNGRGPRGRLDQAAFPRSRLHLCQAELLDNFDSELSRRIDFIFSRGGPKAKDIQLVGNDPSDRAAGLWPSDHAGVVADIRLRERR
jgi:endonuclease/exonuclease/phosphatase family metal-dependent hydrolase